MGKQATGRRGVQFPKTAGDKRSTLSFSKYVWSAAAKAAGIDNEMLRRLDNEKDFRHKYQEYIKAIYEKAAADAKVMYDVAEAGLAAFHDAEKGMQFEENGTEMSLSEALKGPQTATHFEAVAVAGEGKFSRTYPVAFNGTEVLEGEPLKERLRKLVAYGWMEQSAGDAMLSTLKRIEEGKLADNFKNLCFVAIGGTSEMGPVRSLLETGATVLAIARGSAKKWGELIEFAKTTPGTLLVPVLTDEAKVENGNLDSQAGCDVLSHAPELYRLLVSLQTKKTLVIGNYIYLDGELHVRATAVMDVIVREVCRARKATKLAYMCSHSTIYFIPNECANARYEAYQSGKYQRWWMNFGGFAPGQVSKPADGEHVLFNGLNMTQGPNYALAKSLQTWRALLQRRDGHTVSSPIAPATSTASIVSNPTFLYGIQGLYNFGPMIVPGPETTSKLLALVLVYDVLEPKSAASPSTKLAHPLHLFMEEAVHGGQWRAPFAESTPLLAATYSFGRVWGQKTFAQLLDN